MTVSNARRKDDIRKALLAMAGAIADDYCFSRFFAVREFTDILPTTWRELEDNGLVEPRHTFGNPQYQLTEYGWLEALRARGGLEDPEIRRRATCLVQALKRLVDGRDQIHDAIADERDLAPATGLSAGWIHNALKCGLLEEVFPGDKMSTPYDYRSRCFRVPPTFGMGWLD